MKKTKQTRRRTRASKTKQQAGMQKPLFSWLTPLRILYTAKVR